MTTTVMPEKSIHHGRNLRRIREILDIKQDTLASLLGDDWNQQKVSYLEQKEHIDHAILEEVAKALKVPVDAIKNFNEEATVNYVANTFNGNSGNYMNFNPIEKIEQLYERMIKEKDEIIKEQRALIEQFSGKKKSRSK